MLRHAAEDTYKVFGNLIGLRSERRICHIYIYDIYLMSTQFIQYINNKPANPRKNLNHYYITPTFQNILLYSGY